MARRRGHKSRAGGVSPRPDPISPTPTRFMRRRLPSYSLIGNTRPALDHTVLPPPTVRLPLMRTVLRDTTRRRRRPVVALSNRRQADLPHRTLGRLSSWTTYVANPWLVVRNEVPLTRALVCAKRSMRREVLFALGLKNGAGSGGVPKDKVRC